MDHAPPPPPPPPPPVIPPPSISPSFSASLNLSSLTSELLAQTATQAVLSSVAPAAGGAGTGAGEGAGVSWPAMLGHGLLAVLKTVPGILVWAITFTTITLPTLLFALFSTSLTFTMNFTTLWVLRSFSVGGASLLCQIEAVGNDQDVAKLTLFSFMQNANPPRFRLARFLGRAISVLEYVRPTASGAGEERTAYRSLPRYAGGIKTGVGQLFGRVSQCNQSFWIP